MKCQSCGTENPEGAKFCKGCGKQIEAQVQPVAAEPVAPQGEQNAPVQANQTPEVSPAPQAPQPEQQVSQQQQTPQQQTQQTAPVNNVAQPAPAQQVAQQMPPQAQYQTNVFRPVSDNIDNKQYIASPFDSGFADIKESKGWVVRSILLALCSLVPILDWVVQGFAARWGREVCVGINRRLPMSIFDNRTFSTGAKIWACDMVWSIAWIAAFFLSMLIPVLGIIIFIVAFVIFCFISPLLTFQVGLTGKFSAGFSGIGRAFKLFKKAPIQTLAATMAPSLILEAILGAVVLIFFVASLLGFGGGLSVASLRFLSNATASTSIYAAPVNLIYSLMGLITSFMLIFLIMWVVSCFLSAVATVWTYRSIGHLVAREAPEWMTTPGVMDYEQSRGEVTGQPFVPFRK